MAKLEQKRFAAVVRLLRTAYPRAWETHLRALGVTASADPTPAELAQITERVFWLVRQTGIKDPAAWIATDVARVEAATAAVEPEAPAKVAGGIRVHRDRDDLKPVQLGVDLAKTSGASPPTSESATVTNRTTIPELLSRAKLAIAAGEKSLREAADAMAVAQEVYGASQQEIAAAVGKSQAWVSRLLQWCREGFEDDTPFGPASKAARDRAADYQATDKAAAKKKVETQVKGAVVRTAEPSRIACNGAALETEAGPQEKAADESGEVADDELIEPNVPREDFLRSAAEALRLARLYPDPAYIPADAEIKRAAKEAFEAWRDIYFGL